MKDIVVLGSTNTDMVVTGSRLPVPGESVCDGEFKMHPGGKGANEAVAVARLSASRFACEFIGKVGDDVFGRETGERLRSEQIIPKLIVDPEKASGTAVILVDERGQNEISVSLGANGTLSPADIEPFREDITQAKVLVLQLETPLETVAAAAAWAHAAGVTVILKPSPAKPLPRELLGNIDWLIPNAAAAEGMTGVDPVDAASAEKASELLVGQGARNVIITLGDAGAYVAGLGRVVPAPEVDAVDSVAAGDVFVGAFAVALFEGRDLAASVDFAQKAAALSVTRVGAQPSIPSRREIA